MAYATQPLRVHDPSLRVCVTPVLIGDCVKVGLHDTTRHRLRNILPRTAR